MNHQYSVYFAGALFSHKDLLGNRLLAEGIDRQSRGRYACLLPQNLETGARRAVQIRNADLLALLKCDLAIFNFDGAELDSGTVVEFMFAKLLDLPAVLLRTDFRSGGDQELDNWNLMCSGYPRTAVVNLNGMAWYQQHIDKQSLDQENLTQAYCQMVEPIIVGLDTALKQPAVISAADFSLEDLYRWALRFPGGGLIDEISAAELKQLIAEKIKKNIYSDR